MSLAFDAGTYIGRITTWGLTESKHKKTPQIFITFAPLGRIDPAKPDDDQNLIACADYPRTIFWALTPNTMEFVSRNLITLGYPHDTFDQLDPAHTAAHDFKDQEIRVICKHEQYEGKAVERWDLAFSGNGFKPTEMAGAEVKKLNALFGKTLKDARKANAPAAAAAETPARGKQPTGKIPF